MNAILTKISELDLEPLVIAASMMIALVKKLHEHRLSKATSKR